MTFQQVRRCLFVGGPVATALALSQCSAGGDQESATTPTSLTGAVSDSTEGPSSASSGAPEGSSSGDADAGPSSGGTAGSSDPSDPGVDTGLESSGSPVDAGTEDEVVVPLFGATSCSGSGTTYHASPNGSGMACTEAQPCALNTAAGRPAPGDIVCLHGGSYAGRLYVTVSGTANAWISFVAADGELPIINSGGIEVTGSYVSFNGLVSRNAATGFGNRWTGMGTTNSNGNLEFANCVADMNTANGIAFRSAAGVHISQCLVAHNGSSTTNSWSSGVDLFGAQGSPGDNLVESTVSFENVDMQVHSDGSGFIVDDIGTGAMFVNNIGFRNGGSCIRLTQSTNTHIINNSCYHDGLDMQASGPANPGEIFFSSAQTLMGAVLHNNLAAASGWNNTQTSFVNTGMLQIAPFNFGVNANAPAPFFADPAGVHPDFRLTAGATDAIDRGGADNDAPPHDIGFDPRCITMGAPMGQGVQDWWIYSIDYDYIASIGGVARCFRPKLRDATPDLGAYEY